MATCIQCAEDKPSTEFYAHPHMKAGHVNVCKECHKYRMRVRSRTSPGVQEYDRKRAKTPKRRAKFAEYEKRWRAANPNAYRAHYTLTNAVRDGRVIRLPCEFCGREDVHAHHKDYSKPLDVIWPCPKCHHRLHALFPELEGKQKTA